MSGTPTLLHAIGEILRPALLRSGPVYLEETRAKSACAPITLNKTGQAIVVKPDGDAPAVCSTCRTPLGSTVNERIWGLFNSQVPELTGICDYIIFYQENADDDPALFVFLCELKSKNINGATGQAENGRLLAEHIIAMARHHRGARVPPQIHYRGLIFSTKYKPRPTGRLHTRSCDYLAASSRMPDMGFAYYPCGASYPLRHFCA